MKYIVPHNCVEMSSSLIRLYPLNLLKGLCTTKSNHAQLVCAQSFHLGHKPSGLSQSTTSHPLINSRYICEMQGSFSLRPQSQILGTGLAQKRFYNKRKTLKIPPTKPINFDFGGDLTTEDYPLDMSLPKLEFDGADELENADETLKKLLSVEFGDGQHKQKRRIHDLLSKVKEHPLDIRSLEVVIAYQTVAIRNQMRHVLEFRKDKAAKSLLNLRLQARRKHMRRLRGLDIEKFLWLCEELQIKYIPVPEYNRTPSRRALLKKAARDKAISMRKEKITFMKEKLEEEKVDFIKYKEEQLNDIAAELETLNIETGTYLDKVYQAIKQDSWQLLQDKPEPQKKRRMLILEKKFEIAARIKKEREAQAS